MAWTQSDLDKLEKAIANGVRSVEYQDKKITYNSVSEMIQARSIISASLKKKSSIRTKTPEYSKGL